MVQAAKPARRLVLADLFKNQDPIWVVNNAKSSRSGKAGNLVLQIGHGDQRDKILLPPGQDPVCLTDLASRESLQESRDLFLHISRDALILLDPTQAEEYYQQNEKRRDIMRKKVKVLRDGQQLPEAQEPQSANETTVDVDQRVVSVCLKLKTKTITAEEAIENLKEAGADTYKEEDLIYIRNVAKDKKVKAWAQQQLDSL